MLNKFVLSAFGCCLLTACGGAGNPTTTNVDIALASAQVAPDTVANGTISLVSGIAATVDTGTNDMNFADMLNGLRADRGLSAFTYDARLNEAAQNHAEDMVAQGYFSHTSLDGRELGDRINETGYNAISGAENIARGHQSQGHVLQDWIESEGHNENLNRDNEDFALGAAGSGANLTWVLVLATEG